MIKNFENWLNESAKNPLSIESKGFDALDWQKSRQTSGDETDLEAGDCIIIDKKVHAIRKFHGKTNDDNAKWSSDFMKHIFKHEYEDIALWVVLTEWLPEKETWNPKEITKKIVNRKIEGSDMKVVNNPVIDILSERIKRMFWLVKADPLMIASRTQEQEPIFSTSCDVSQVTDLDSFQASCRFEFVCPNEEIWQINTVVPCDEYNENLLVILRLNNPNDKGSNRDDCFLLKRNEKLDIEKVSAICKRIESIFKEEKTFKKLLDSKTYSEFKNSPEVAASIRVARTKVTSKKLKL